MCERKAEIHLEFHRDKGDLSGFINHHVEGIAEQ